MIFKATIHIELSGSPTLADLERVKENISTHVDRAVDNGCITDGCSDNVFYEGHWLLYNKED